MRTSILAVIVAFGTTMVVPALAQQQTGPSQQEDADKGVKTRNSGESGYVSEQEKPGASSHAPGQPDTKSNLTTTGTSSGTQDSGIAGDVKVREQEQKPRLYDGYDHWDEQRPKFRSSRQIPLVNGARPDGMGLTANRKAGA